jgi:predicted metal-dependent HD superfamily phosphohydrolase
MAPDSLISLESRWTELLSGLGVQTEDARRTFATLAGSFQSPARHYHTLEHVRALLDDLAGVNDERARAPELLLAVWLHDAIYDSRRTDNEEQSAAFAEALLRPLNLPARVLQELARLILLTKRHQADPADVTGRMLLDADLAILGAEETGYDAYSAAIRREYDWVPADAYRAGRLQVLEGFLRRDRIYTTPHFAQREGRARQNLRREIAALASQK